MQLEEIVEMQCTLYAVSTSGNILQTVVQYHNQDIDSLFQMCFSGLPFNFTWGTSHGTMDVSAQIRVKIVHI